MKPQKKTINEYYAQDLADRLGYLLAQKANLDEEISAVKADLIDKVKSGESVNGDNYRVVHVEQHAKNVNWKNIAEKFEPSRQLVRGNTKFIEKHIIKCTARKED